jgi:hypothetical protein
MTRIALIGLAAASFTLAACNSIYDHNEPLNAGFGNTVKHNEAVAIIDPTPANASDGAPNLEAKRAKLAIERYESGAVSEADAESVSDSF